MFTEYFQPRLPDKCIVIEYAPGSCIFDSHYCKVSSSGFYFCKSLIESGTGNNINIVATEVLFCSHFVKTSCFSLNRYSNMSVHLYHTLLNSQGPLPEGPLRLYLYYVSYTQKSLILFPAKKEIEIEEGKEIIFMYSVHFLKNVYKNSF